MDVLDQSKGETTLAPNEKKRAAIAMSLVTKGGEFLKAGQHQRALAAYRHARDILDGLSVSQKDNTDLGLTLSLVFRKIGDALRVQGDLAEAKEAYLSSLAIAEGLANFHPDNAELQRNRDEALAALATVSDARKSGPDNVKETDNAKDIAPPLPSLHEALVRAAEKRVAASAPAADGPIAEQAAPEMPVAEELRRTRGRSVLDDPTGRLVENIPRKMRIGVLEKVEVRIARSAVEGLTERMTGGGRLHRHEVRVADAMTVRLRALDGGFLIDPLSAETCWTHKAKSAGFQEKDFASWRWSVTPQRRGRARLLLIISAQTLDANGVAAEAALPDQVIKVYVRVNYGRAARKVVGWGLLMVAGGALNAWGRELYPAALDALGRVSGLLDKWLQ
jgi:hypothetical protein